MIDPIPLSPTSEARIRAVVRQEARRVRLAMAEAALHGTFALAAVVWAIGAVLA